MDRAGDKIFYDKREQRLYGVPAVDSVRDALANAQKFDAVADGLYAQADEAAAHEDMDGGQTDRGAEALRGQRISRAHELRVYVNDVMQLCAPEIIALELTDPPAQG